jgi:hypothetical protein
MENWLDVVGYEGIYQVSDLGNVRSVARYTTNRITGVRYWRKAKPRKTELGRNGYVRVIFRREGTTKNKSVHRLVAEAFIGTDDRDVCHNNGQRHDNRLTNLRYGTHLENMADRTKHGNTLIGTKHWKAILNDDQIVEIRKRLQRGDFQREIAADYGVQRSAISSISTGANWSHII